MRNAPFSMPNERGDIAVVNERRDSTPGLHALHVDRVAGRQFAARLGTRRAEGVGMRRLAARVELHQQRREEIPGGLELVVADEKAAVAAEHIED